MDGVLEKESWGEEDIDERAEWLADKALAVWSSPLPAPHPENVHVIVDAGFRRLRHVWGRLRLQRFFRRRIDWLAERQEELPLLQGLAQLAIGDRQAHFPLANSAIESLSAFCTLTEGLTSTWVSVSLAVSSPACSCRSRRPSRI